MNEAIKIFTRTTLDTSVDWENEYREVKHFNDSERKKFFTNWDEGLVKKVRDDRTSKN